MAKGPQGQKRPRDVVGCAVTVMKIATGQIEEQLPDPRRNGGLKGGKARAEVLDAKRRSEIASKAARARWAKSKT